MTNVFSRRDRFVFFALHQQPLKSQTQFCSSPGNLDWKSIYFGFQITSFFPGIPSLISSLDRRLVCVSLYLSFRLKKLEETEENRCVFVVRREGWRKRYKNSRVEQTRTRRIKEGEGMTDDLSHIIFAWIHNNTDTLLNNNKENWYTKDRDRYARTHERSVSSCYTSWEHACLTRVTHRESHSTTK